MQFYRSFGAALLISLSLSGLEFASAQEERVGEIRGDTSRIERRMETLNLWELGFGGGNGDHMNLDHALYAFNLAHHWETNVNSEIRATGHLSSSWEGAFSSLSVGGAYLPLPTSVSPIIGGDFGYGYSAIRDRNDQSGFALGAFGGARLFRTARAQMSIEGYYRTILVSGARPQVYGITLGALF
jgi:hypothetical protein